MIPAALPSNKPVPLNTFIAGPHRSLFDEIKNNPRYSPSRSHTWFMNNVRDLAQSKGYGPMALLGDNPFNQESSVRVGGMYCFTYDPKYKKELPYYDTFPLILPFNMDAEHFTGINLHYLAPRARLVLFEKLVPYAAKDDDESIRISWQILSNFSRFPEVEPCVKKYLKKQVKSRFLRIGATDWINAIFLPVERFKKADNQKVWSDSRRKSRK